jgi:hypothetical protein
MRTEPRHLPYQRVVGLEQIAARVGTQWFQLPGRERRAPCLPHPLSPDRWYEDPAESYSFARTPT